MRLSAKKETNIKVFMVTRERSPVQTGSNVYEYSVTIYGFEGFGAITHGRWFIDDE